MCPHTFVTKVIDEDQFSLYTLLTDTSLKFFIVHQLTFILNLHPRIEFLYFTLIGVTTGIRSTKSVCNIVFKKAS